MAKKEVVQDIFNDIAPKYDLLNHLLSMNIDKGWRRKAMSCIGEQEKGCLLDVACGTGDFSIAAHRAGVKQVTGIDISENMVEIGKYFYEQAKGNPPPELMQYFNNIRVLKDSIEISRSEIQSIDEAMTARKNSNNQY